MLVAQLVKNTPELWETWVQSLGWEDPLQKGKATCSSILAWRLPWIVQSLESQRFRHDWMTFTFHMHLWHSYSEYGPRQHAPESPKMLNKHWFLGYLQNSLNQIHCSLWSWTLSRLSADPFADWSWRWNELSSKHDEFIVASPLKYLPFIWSRLR